ncbi:MAG: hypothetical protein BWY17_02669 [Deltaproteobacteria bacterium ADurb.Bin207]|nr:MAG: hypothetical protein BWY17_02669 [Deltaproteobacteria bacterium ADurb.Bin207]
MEMVGRVRGNAALTVRASADFRRLRWVFAIHPPKKHLSGLLAWHFRFLWGEARAEGKRESGFAEISLFRGVEQEVGGFQRGTFRSLEPAQIT